MAILLILLLKYYSMLGLLCANSLFYPMDIICSITDCNYKIVEWYDVEKSLY